VGKRASAEADIIKERFTHIISGIFNFVFSYITGRCTLNSKVVILSIMDVMLFSKLTFK